MTATTSPDLKQNPVIQALWVGAVVSAFWYSVLVPVFTQRCENKLATNADVVANANANEEKRISLERQLKDALGRIRALENPNLFSLGNPYPIGLGLVKVAQPVEDVAKAYLGATIERNDGFLTLMKFHSVFEKVTFYADKKQKDKISHISFVVGWGREDNFLLNKLTEILGPPTTTRRGKFHEWKTGAKASVYHNAEGYNGRYFMVMQEGFQPNWWPPN